MGTLHTEVADAWHRYQEKFESANASGEAAPDENDVDFWSVSVMLGLVDGCSSGDLEDYWCILENIWSSMDCSNMSRVGIFAASLVEDLISGHGHLFIDRIEEKARSDESFRRMLRGVWPPSNEDRSDWQRIVKLVEDLGPVQSFKP